MSVTHLSMEDVRRQMEQERLEGLVRCALDDQKQMSAVLSDFRAFQSKLDIVFP